MRVEVRKINGHYMIPELDKMNLKVDHFSLEIPDEIIKNNEQNQIEKLSGEYIQENWKELIGIALSDYDENFKTPTAFLKKSETR